MLSFGQIPFEGGAFSPFLGEPDLDVKGAKISDQ
jgi:hypothetical protein